jgi:hypothetical protein
MPDTQLRVLRSLFAGETKDIFSVAYNLRHVSNQEREEPFPKLWSCERAPQDSRRNNAQGRSK